MTNTEILTRSFKNLTLKSLNNLKFHVDNNTEIFCGPTSDRELLSPEGYG